jgi:hypothetical protein
MFCTNTDCPDYLATGFHAEFRPGITVCPSCGEALAESLDTAPAVEPTRDDSRPETADDDLWNALDGLELPCELEPVMETTGVDEALVVRSLLDGAWIPSVVTPRERLGDGSAVPDAPPRVREGLRLVVLVPANLADEARERLDEMGEG